MKLVNWNLGSLKSLMTAKSTRAKQSRSIMKRLAAAQYDLIGLQEVKLPPSGPDKKERHFLHQLLPNYQLVWRAAQKPARTSYAGTMILYRPGLVVKQVLRPNIDRQLDAEGRLLGIELADFTFFNSYIPHYEYHHVDQHRRWMSEFISLVKDQVKPLVVAGDLTILPAKTTRQTTLSNKALQLFQQQYRDLQQAGLADAYRIAPNQSQDATWWAPNIPKQVERGMRTDFWMVSRGLQERIVKAGPVDTGQRRDHAPVELVLTADD